MVIVLSVPLPVVLPLFKSFRWHCHSK